MIWQIKRVDEQLASLLNMASVCIYASK